MRNLRICALLLAFSAVPGICQNVPPLKPVTAEEPAAAPVPLPPSTTDPSIDYAALREQVSQQNKALASQVATQRAIVRKNQELLREAQKLQAANMRLAEEKKKLEAQNVELEKERTSLASKQKPAN